MRKTLGYGLYINLGLLIVGNILALYRGEYGIGFVLTIVTSGIFLGLMHLSKFIEKRES
jgi:hypothetical protein